MEDLRRLFPEICQSHLKTWQKWISGGLDRLGADMAHGNGSQKKSRASQCGCIRRHHNPVATRNSVVTSLIEPTTTRHFTQHPNLNVNSNSLSLHSRKTRPPSDCKPSISAHSNIYPE